MSTCGWLRKREAERLTVRAFHQAMAEFGIPHHPGGECPFPGCQCADLADQVEARAVQIVEAALGRPLPEVTP